MKDGLVIFDIDGTLTDTNEVDGRCFARAMQDVFGIRDIAIDWAEYEHTTDSGILRQLLRDELKREVTDEVLKPFKQTFLSYFESEFKASRSHFAEVPGSSQIFEFVLRETKWGIAIATGAWEASARFKLRAADVPSHYPAGFAEDSVDRKEIIMTALERAKSFYKQNHFEAVTYVGDGIWDLKASKALGIGFVGIDVKGTDQRLKPQGAFTLRDYRDPMNFVEAVRHQSRLIYR